MPASIRIIKIVKDPFGSEAYTVEFECEAENAKDLLQELMASPYGQRAIELLNQAEFLPEQTTKSSEELKNEALKEEKEIAEAREATKELGRAEGVNTFFRFLRDAYGDDFVKQVEEKMEEARVKEEEARKKVEQEAVKKANEENREPE